METENNILTGICIVIIFGMIVYAVIQWAAIFGVLPSRGYYLSPHAR